MGGVELRLEVIFDTEQLPLHYHFMFTSIIKKAISVISKEKMEELYYFGDKHNKKSKNFTWSIFMEKFKKDDDVFQIEGSVKWILTSNDHAFLLYLYNGLLSQRAFTYKDFTVKVRNISAKESPVIRSHKCLFRTLSPITVKTKKGDMLSVDDPNFSKEFSYICAKTIENVAGRNIYEPLIFSPKAMKQVVVQLKHDQFQSMNNESILYVKSYNGVFQLEGHPEDLNILSQVGTSFRRSQGFGCIELIKQQ
jgi:CRISPR-associated endoribonuclease Cas6